MKISKALSCILIACASFLQKGNELGRQNWQQRHIALVSEYDPRRQQAISMNGSTRQV